MAALRGPVYGVFTMGSLINGYIIAHEDGGLTLVDTGHSLSFIDAVTRTLSTMQRSLEDIRHIFITHSHFDHVGSLAALQARINPTTYAHRMDAPVIKGEKPNDMPVPETWFQKLVLPRIDPNTVNPARVDKLLNDGDDTSFIYPGAQVVHLPGHSFGQIGLWLPEQSIFIGGDAMMRMPWGLRPPPLFISPNVPQALQSIRRVADLAPDALMLAHGRPILSGAAAQIERLAVKMGV